MKTVIPHKCMATLGICAMKSQGSLAHQARWGRKDCTSLNALDKHDEGDKLYYNAMIVSGLSSYNSVRMDISFFQNDAHTFSKQAGLDPQRVIGKQDMEKLTAYTAAMKDKHPFLNKFEGDWPS